MDFRNVRHLREILVTNAQGKTTSTMQYSSQSISRFRPSFVQVPFKDQKVARELYARSGGRRREGARIGMEVILEITAAGDLAT
jgi:hypothetical protein